MNSKLAALVVLLFASSIALAQEITGWQTQAQLLAKNRRLWESTNVQRYHFTMDAACFGCPWYFPAVIEVENQKIISILNPDTGEPISQKKINGKSARATPEQAKVHKTVEGLFTIIEDLIQKHPGAPDPQLNAHILHVEYDSRYGFPTLIQIDRSRTVTADGGVAISSDTQLTYRQANFSVDD